MGKPFILENEKTRKQLVLLANTITDADLKKDDGEGWSLGVVFAHIAFWDQRTIVWLGRWKENGVATSPVDIEAINESLTPFLKAIPPRVAIDMALGIAETLCRQIENLADGLVIAIEAFGDQRRLSRFIHWQMHIEQIKKIIKS